MRPDIGSLILKEEALKRIFAAWIPERETEMVSLSEADGRVLGEDQFAKYNLPVVRKLRVAFSPTGSELVPRKHSQRMQCISPHWEKRVMTRGRLLRWNCCGRYSNIFK
ncbi:MAG: hypothetical protein LUC83_01560 [Clostridiales bacterium]|nr:hypothetical protein [Clostridiales bacterium]